MKIDIQVSVIVLTYNPILSKLERTLKSVLHQNELNYEIIVSDDGSRQDYQNEIRDIIKDAGFINYTYNKNQKNLGTVHNIISALSVVRGKYVYLLSPGDLLYDDNVLYELYEFAESKSAKICFGQHLDYNIDNQKINIFNERLLPKNIGVYNKSHKSYKTSFLLCDYIIGPAYFREKSLFIELINYVSKYSRYVEDTTTTAYALALNVPVHYFPKKIVWYEIGSGISQGIGFEWNNKVEKDIINTLFSLTKKFPKDRVINAGLKLRSSNNNRDIIKCILQHPFLFFRKIINNLTCEKSYVNIEDFEYKLLQSKL